MDHVKRTRWFATTVETAGLLLRSPDCLLTIGSQCLAAILAEEGDTSLHVLIQGSPLFWVEDTGVLQTTDVEIPVRVSNIVRMEADEDDSVSSMPSFRIGLTRLGQPVRENAVAAVANSAGRDLSRTACAPLVNRIRISWAA